MIHFSGTEVNTDDILRWCTLMIYFAGAKVDTDDILCRCQGEH